jgi:soluble P-type ATPase
VHDITQLEARGIPAVFVASAEFESAASAQAEALGLDVARVFVPHPIQDRSDDEMVALADGAFGAIVASLVVT